MRWSPAVALLGPRQVGKTTLAKKIAAAFPGSTLAPDEAVAWGWREAFIRNFLSPDLPMPGVGAASDTMHRFWRMLAHPHGQLFNASAIAASLGVSGPTVSRCLDGLAGCLMLRL